jgi:hypothetical protein
MGKRFGWGIIIIINIIIIIIIIIIITTTIITIIRCYISLSLQSYHLPLASLDSAQLFDCLFASTCEGAHRPYRCRIHPCLPTHRHGAGQPASSAFNQTAVTEYWDALFDL